MDSTQQNLEAICDEIGKSLALEIDRSNPDEIIGKLGNLTVLLATSSHACALAEMIYAEKVMSLVKENQFLKLGENQKKMLFAGMSKKEGYYVKLCEEQNKSIKYSIEALRSMLSYLKQEMQSLPTN